MGTIRGKLASLLRRSLRSGPRAGTYVTTSVGEITPCNGRPVTIRGDVRLNLLLPSINAQHYFGGIHTAVQIYSAICKLIPQSRIVLLDSSPDEAALSRFSDHRLVPAGEDSDFPRHIVPFSDRYGRTLPVGAEDYWLATSWWTAYAAQRMSDWQDAHFGHRGRLTYLIQDFEPGFYPWSSQYALAASTYRPRLDRAVFNTQLLANYFHQRGIQYDVSLVFEPTLNGSLAKMLDKLPGGTTLRTKQIVIYARPSTPRNAFELLCEGLRAWGWKDAQAAEWEVVAAGELVEDVDLGPFKVRALGKLSIEAYGELLSNSAIGISLMLSPHPSYPPMEMAAFGMGVITNNFGGKDLSAWAPNIRSIDTCSPEAIAEAIGAECARWRDASMQSYAKMAPTHPFLGHDDTAALGERLADALLTDAGVR